MRYEPADAAAQQDGLALACERSDAETASRMLQGIGDLDDLLIEAGHHHRPTMDTYLINTISRQVAPGEVLPYYIPGGTTPEHLVARKRLLDLGAVVITPQGETWDGRAVWNGGQGGPPQGSVVLLSR